MKKDDVTARKPNIEKMESALEAVAAALEDATDILHDKNGESVTSLKSWQIEQIFDGLCSVMVQVDEALAHKREQQPIAAPPLNRARKPKLTP